MIREVALFIRWGLCLFMLGVPSTRCTSILDKTTDVERCHPAADKCDPRDSGAANGRIVRSINI